MLCSPDTRHLGLHCRFYRAMLRRAHQRGVATAFRPYARLSGCDVEVSWSGPV